MFKLSAGLVTIASLILSIPTFAQESCDTECQLERLASDCSKKTETPDDAYLCFSDSSEASICADLEILEGLACKTMSTTIGLKLKAGESLDIIKGDWGPPMGDLISESFAIEKIGQPADRSTTHEFTLVCSGSDIMIGYRTVDSGTYFATDTNKMTEGSTITVAFDNGSAAEVEWRPTPKDTLILLSPDNGLGFVEQLKGSETFVITTNTNSGSNSVNFEVGNLEAAYVGLGGCSDE